MTEKHVHDTTKPTCPICAMIALTEKLYDPRDDQGLVSSLETQLLVTVNNAMKEGMTTERHAVLAVARLMHRLLKNYPGLRLLSLD